MSCTALNANLAVLLRTIAARHQAESGIYYVALDLAVWSDDHLRELAEHGRRQGLRLSARRRTAALTAPLQSWIADVLRRRPEPTLMLLADLRRLHRAAAGVSLDWELLGQAAQAAKDQGLLDMTSRCHPQTLRQMRWANAMLKELSPQALTS